MVRRDLIRSAYEARVRIEKELSKAGRHGLTLIEIARRTGLSPATVKRHLEKLVSIGRVDVEFHRGSAIYRINGRELYSETVELSKDHILYLDVFLNPWGRPYIRVKERKKDPYTGEYIDIGAVIIDKDKIEEFIEKIKQLAKNIPKYQQ
ncbi:MAG: winged helix-turn-helix domain-containing protein [Desulfurococcales archaeon]|nr:winged helix-turn-helix domain-containing protein [Desulfurococcales archaeon]